MFSHNLTEIWNKLFQTMINFKIIMKEKFWSYYLQRTDTWINSQKRFQIIRTNWKLVNYIWLFPFFIENNWWILVWNNFDGINLFLFLSDNYVNELIICIRTFWFTIAILFGIDVNFFKNSNLKSIHKIEFYIESTKILIFTKFEIILHLQ